jgi:transposase
MKLYLQADKIFIANKAVDFRKSLDGLSALVAEEMQEEPTEGLYIFYNKTRDRIKIIGHHTNGFIMLYKRLERGKFFVELSGDKIRINRQQLEWLMLGVDWKLLSKTREKYGTYC